MSLEVLLLEKVVSLLQWECQQAYEEGDDHLDLEVQQRGLGGVGSHLQRESSPLGTVKQRIEAIQGSEYGPAPHQ
jgi:hypothetical protein